MARKADLQIDYLRQWCTESSSFQSLPMKRRQELLQEWEEALHEEPEMNIEVAVTDAIVSALQSYIQGTLVSLNVLKRKLQLMREHDLA